MVVSIVSLGVGANVAIFSLFDQILLRPLPVAAPEQLVNLSDPGEDPDAIVFPSMSGGQDSVFSYPMFRDLERSQQTFAGIAAHRFFTASLSAGESARQASGFFVSGNYFSMLGLQAVLGRLIGPEDDRVDGQAQSVVLSHAYWQAEFGADRDVIGRTLIVNGVPLTIVGIAPPGFHGITLGARASVFVPMSFPGPTVPNHDERNFYWVHLFARLKPGVGRDEAAVGINSLYRTILTEFDAPLQIGADAQELAAFRAKSLVLESGALGQSAILVPVRDRLRLLAVVSLALLTLCCANVAGLTLVRSLARTGEIAVRMAIGDGCSQPGVHLVGGIRASAGLRPDAHSAGQDSAG